MRKAKATFLCAIALVAAAWLQARQAAPSNPAYWEPSVRNFEQQDQKNPPPKGEILFTGSSSIVLWDLPRSFPDLKTINRGFGGSEMSDAAHYASRLVVPYAPRIVVLYSGDNDIGRGVAPETVLASVERFVGDGLHMNAEGYRIWARLLRPHLN